MVQALELERAEANLRGALESRPEEVIGEFEGLLWQYYERAHELYQDFASGKLGVDEFVLDADSLEREFQLDANLAFQTLQRLVESDAARRLAEIAGVSERLAFLASLPVIFKADRLHREIAREIALPCHVGRVLVIRTGRPA